MADETLKPKHAGGRPRKYGTAEELQAEIDRYFAEGISVKKVVTGPPNKREIEEIEIPSVVELGLWLGFNCRETLLEYAKRGEFSNTVKIAISQIEAWHEVNATTGNGAGSIFWLKNHGWIDEKTQNVNIKELPPITVVVARMADASKCQTDTETKAG